jgi:hypothetical protein
MKIMDQKCERAGLKWSLLGSGTIHYVTSSQRVLEAPDSKLGYDDDQG